MVEVFKTDIKRKREALPLLKKISKGLPGHIISIDMQDCDKVLRIEGEKIKADKVIKIIRKQGYQCSILKN